MLKPLKDFVVVRLVKEDEKTAGGWLYKPATVEEKVVTGTVLAIGSGYLTDSGSVVPLEVHVEDRVMFNKNMAVEVKDAGETLYLVREEHVLSVVK